jgi:hypothetical protein
MVNIAANIRFDPGTEQEYVQPEADAGYNILDKHEEPDKNKYHFFPIFVPEEFYNPKQSCDLKTKDLYK